MLFDLSIPYIYNLFHSEHEMHEKKTSSVRYFVRHDLSMTIVIHFSVIEVISSIEIDPAKMARGAADIICLGVPFVTKNVISYLRDSYKSDDLKLRSFNFTVKSKQCKENYLCTMYMPGVLLSLIHFIKV